MMFIYPFSLYVQKSGNGDTPRKENGTYQPPITELEFVSECRDTVNASGEKVEGAGGDYHVYASLLFAPLTLREISPGTYVEVRDSGGKIRQKGKVIRFSRDLMACRVFI